MSERADECKCFSVFDLHFKLELTDHFANESTAAAADADCVAVPQVRSKVQGSPNILISGLCQGGFQTIEYPKTESVSELLRYDLKLLRKSEDYRNDSRGTTIGSTKVYR